MGTQRKNQSGPAHGRHSASRIAAVVTAAVLLLGSGLAYRIYARQLARPSDSTPLPAGTLERIPLTIGQWRGRDVPLDEAVIKATDTDAHVNRAYAETDGIQRVGFYLAYGIRGRDLLPHRPEVCYPGGGWTLQDKKEVELGLDGGGKLPVRIMNFTRGTLGGASIIVLNYYIVDGQYSPDVSLLRSKAWHGQGGIHYMVQVQITSTGDVLGSMETAEEAVRRFAKLSLPEIRAVLPQPGVSEAEPKADES